MNTGNIRERVKLSNPVRTENGAGGYDIKWVVSDVRACVTHLGISKLASMGMKWESTQLRMNQSFQFNILNRPGLVLTEETLIQYKGHDLTIHSISDNLKNPKEWIVLAVNNTGAK